MQNRNESYLNRRERVRRGDEFSIRQDSTIVTRIPNQTSDEIYLATSPDLNIYRQALAVIVETPEIAERLDYITAGTIVTILGSWLTGLMIKSRIFKMLSDMILFFIIIAFAGFLVGVMLGKGFIPREILPVLVFGLIGLSVFVLVILLGSLLLQSTQANHV